MAEFHGILVFGGSVPAFEGSSHASGPLIHQSMGWAGLGWAVRRLPSSRYFLDVPVTGLGVVCLLGSRGRFLHPWMTLSTVGPAHLSGHNASPIVTGGTGVQVKRHIFQAKNNSDASQSSF